jgi:hypothetical protein
MALTNVQKVRLEIGDTDVALPILSDDEYSYFLTKNNDSIKRAALDAAKTILFKLSINASDQSVDIFSIKGKAAADSYKEALRLYIKNPDLNGIFSNITSYFGGISNADIQSVIDNPDNNLVTLPSEQSKEYTYVSGLNI